MSWWRRTPRQPPEAQLDLELQYHLDELTREFIDSGLPPEEARRRALIEFGGPAQIREELRDVHRLAILDASRRNFKAALRFIRRSPSFSMTVVLTLGLGIGANSAVFSAIDAILLRPLPFPDGDQLMKILQSGPKSGNATTFVAPVRLEDWNRLNSTFQAMTGYYTEDITEISGPLPEKITQALVSPRFLQVWGILPTLGRDFNEQELHFGGPAAALISERLWRRRFAADPAAIGKKLQIVQGSVTIVGVLPASFRFPLHEVDLWSPIPIGSPYSQSRDAT